MNDPALIDRAEVIREKGTNRSQFFRGQVDKYTWRDIGSSYLMSDLQAAYLWGQLEVAERINQRRLALWQKYYDSFLPLAKAGCIELPVIPADCVHNAHMFYIKLRDIDDRTAFIDYLKEAGSWRCSTISRCMTARPANVLVALPAKTVIPRRKARAWCAYRCSTICPMSISVR